MRKPTYSLMHLMFAVRFVVKIKYSFISLTEKNALIFFFVVLYETERKIAIFSQICSNIHTKIIFSEISFFL